MPWPFKTLWRRIAVTVVVAAVGLRLFVFATSVRHIPATADESIVFLQATGITQAGDSAAYQAKQHPPFLWGRLPLLFMAQPHLLPIDAYMNAPVARGLPRNAFGARWLPFACGCLAVLVALRFVHRAVGVRPFWPTVCLLLFPSAYLAEFIMGAVLPVYPTLLLLWMLCVWALGRQAKSDRRWWLWAGLAGFLAGLGCSASLLTLPFAMAALLGVVLSGGWRRALLGGLATLVGIGMGLGPLVAAKLVYPGAYADVSSRRPLGEAIRLLWEPTLTYTLPSAMGIRGTLFPDSAEAIVLLRGLEKPFAVVWSVLFALALAIVAARMLKELRRDHRLRLAPMELFVLVPGLSLGLHVLNARAHAGDYRYLLPLVWSFPFMVGYLYAAVPRAGKAVLGTLAISLALLNIGTTLAVARQWTSDAFASRKLYLHDVRPAIAYLNAKDINHAYATYWNAYRITFESGERILCSQPWNELFGDWPIPYHAAVTAATNIAVVMSEGFRFLPEPFEKDLEAMGVAYTKAVRGAFSIYSDFAIATPKERQVPTAFLTMRASHQASTAAMLNDGDVTTRWRTRQAQEAGMWVEAQLAAPQRLSRVSLFYDGYPHDQAMALRIQARNTDGEWVAVRQAVAATLDPFDFRNGHPVFGHQLQAIRFDPVVADALRVEIAEVNPGRDWTLGEIKLYGPPAGQDRADD